MGKVMYSMSVSLDGHIEDVGRSIELSAPDEEIHPGKRAGASIRIPVRAESLPGDGGVVTVGGGKQYFPSGRQLDLRLPEEPRVASGAVYLRYERAS